MSGGRHFAGCHAGCHAGCRVPTRHPSGPRETGSIFTCFSRIPSSRNAVDSTFIARDRGPRWDRGGIEADQGGIEEDRGGSRWDRGGIEEDRGRIEWDQGGIKVRSRRIKGRRGLVAPCLCMDAACVWMPLMHGCHLSMDATFPAFPSNDAIVTNGLLAESIIYIPKLRVDTRRRRCPRLYMRLCVRLCWLCLRLRGWGKVVTRLQ